jgi:hypothetical protein
MTAGLDSPLERAQRSSRRSAWDWNDLRRDLVDSRGLNPRPDLDDDHFYIASAPWAPSRGWREGSGQPDTNARLATFGKPVGPKFTAAGYAPFDDPEKEPNKKAKKRRKRELKKLLKHGWSFDDSRWDGLLTAPCRRAERGALRGEDLVHWWHCQQCRRRDLLPRLAQIENKSTWTLQEMDALDDVFSSSSTSSEDSIAAPAIGGRSSPTSGRHRAGSVLVSAAAVIG